MSELGWADLHKQLFAVQRAVGQSTSLSAWSTLTRE